MVMDSIHKDLQKFRKNLEEGSIQRAYGALLSYMMGLRTYFVKKFGRPTVSSLYQGYMDMTYFALYPPALKDRGLKVAIVFNYDAFQFEAWLTARNRKVQREYWERFKDSQWSQYRLVAPAVGIDSIIESDLAAEFDLDHPEALTASIEKSTLAFIKHIERFLSKT
jgi:hypothetical protein